MEFQNSVGVCCRYNATHIDIDGTLCKIEVSSLPPGCSPAVLHLPPSLIIANHCHPVTFVDVNTWIHKLTRMLVDPIAVESKPLVSSIE